MKYAVVIEKARTGFSAYVPDLPGCVATGRTRAAVASSIRSAIRFHLDGLREDGAKVPKPAATTVYVSTSAAPGETRRRRAAARKKAA